MSLLEVKNLRIYFPVNAAWFGTQSHLKAVDDVSLRVEAGETLGLVGESGCGKTTLGRAIMCLVRPTAGAVFLEGEEISALTGRPLRERRRKFQMVFQDSSGSLNPRMTVRELVSEALQIHRLAPTRLVRRERVGALLRAVGLDAAHEERYAHELSGGQRQRVGIARALAVNPRLLVCDEAVSALDVSVQAQMINLLRDLQREHKLAYLFIAHDLAVVEHISHRVAVMYLGKIVESGDAKEIVRLPRHPYTQALISAAPVLAPAPKRRGPILRGDVPSPFHPPNGCPFHPRCPVAEARCAVEVPSLRELAPGHWAACHLAK